ncbi:hypothetical protein COV16_00425 [Candidatus Woesearchaeota archaeon CG10_big_fil_rev_8_21_14_0_10_34_8]|jgi:class 3 adenylate cyclase|nr:MAG: hypothetical protein COV16_00425 [Candidatus Woesearchaeota archaeon CG10_big_fil_rev_8_21_14_0_10_34_8]
METKNLTIMFTDLKGYTSKTSNSTRQVCMDLLDRYEYIVTPIFKRYDGEIIKEIGDAFMVAFESPTNAVLCGIEIQEEIFRYNSIVNKENRLRLKVAINSGEVQIRKNDIYGEAVNIASRLESAVEVDDVFLTDSVYLSMNKSETPPAFYVGPYKFKGIPERVNVYKILGENTQVTMVKRKRKKRGIKKAIKIVLASAIIITLGVLILGNATAIENSIETLTIYLNNIFII